MDSGRIYDSHDWTDNQLRCSELDPCLELDLRECTVEPFEATRDDRRECLDTQSRPPQCSELVVGVMLNRGRQSSACANVLLN